MTNNSHTLVLVRHGETAANQAFIIQGTTDVPLNDIGRSQAAKLGKYFDRTNTHFDQIYASDLSRAFETAQLATNAPIKIDKRLRERAFGTIEGKHVNSYREEARKAGLKEKELSYHTPEGAETLPQVYARVKDFFMEEIIPLSKEPSRRILIVTHGGVIREFLRFFRDECHCDFYGMEIMKVTPNTGVSVFVIDFLENKKVRAKFFKLHDRAHLEDENGNEETSKIFMQNSSENKLISRN